MTKYPDFLENAFHQGYAFTSEDYSGVCDIQMVGTIHINSGKIIACDPYLLADVDPFTENFPTGMFPVELAIAKIDDDYRIAFARIRFSDEVPSHWAPALIEGENPDELEEDEFFGYDVESGTGCFMDEVAFNAYRQVANDEDFLDDLEEELDENYEDTRAWLMKQVEGSNIAMFTSGWGDGTFGSYIGYDSDHRVCRLVTDFGVIDWPEE